MRYRSPADPAPSSQTLLDFLLEEEGRGHRYVYRGQLREWPGPLLPSLYRRSIQPGRTLTRSDPEFQTLNLRGCGRSFVEIQPDSGMASMVREAGAARINRETYLGLVELARDHELSQDVCLHGHERAFLRRLPAAQHEAAKPRLALWRMIVDEIHRADIRQWGFLQPYGYVLGMILAQQYGFTSELLDFTSRPAVALFFATHPDPYYQFVRAAELAGMTGSELGVVYRLPSSEGQIACERIDSFRYDTCPAQIHMSDVCRRLEDLSSPEMLEQLQGTLDEETMGIMLNGGAVVGDPAELLDAVGPREGTAVDQFLRLYYDGGGIRYHRLLNTPPGTFANSRMGRQGAVAVIVDELRRTVAHPDGDYATFQAVEDVSMRDGFERFYFRHTETPPALEPLCREYLWPEQDDFYKALVSRAIDPATQAYRFRGHSVPKRRDLVSDGFLLAPDER